MYPGAARTLHLPNFINRYSVSGLRQQDLTNEQITEIILAQINVEAKVSEAIIAVANAERENIKYDGMDPQQKLEFNEKGINHVLFVSFLISNSR